MVAVVSNEEVSLEGFEKALVTLLEQPIRDLAKS
jgi:hypothetical protein